jgi:hypothetical protein
MAFVFPLSQEEPTAEDRFIDLLTQRLKRYEIPVTDKQVDALESLHPLFVSMSKKPPLRDLFWFYVAEPKIKVIPWEQAEKNILSGKISSVSVWHDQTVDLYGRYGEHYKTKEPRINALADAVSNVDPKGVFIEYETE